LAVSALHVLAAAASAAFRSRATLHLENLALRHQDAGSTSEPPCGGEGRRGSSGHQTDGKADGNSFARFLFL
jgi:hypothetical protein